MEDDAGSEASEWGLREQREREEERSVEAEKLGAVGEEYPVVLPMSTSPRCMYLGRMQVMNKQKKF